MNTVPFDFSTDPDEHRAQTKAERRAERVHKARLRRLSHARAVKQGQRNNLLAAIMGEDFPHSL